MKIRNGFVSNSSSSSFVVVGFLVRTDQFSSRDYLEKLYQTEVPEDPELIDYEFQDARYGNIRVMDEDDGVPDGQSLVAYEVAGWSDSDGLEKLTGVDIQAITQQVEQARTRLGLTAEDAAIEIWAGTSYC